MPLGRKKREKDLAPADELARSTCALFGNLMSVLERHYGERPFDFPRILLFANAAVAEFYRHKRGAPVTAEPRLADFERRAAASVAASLYDFGHIDDRAAFCAACRDQSLPSFAAVIADDIEALIEGDERAAERLSATFRRNAVGDEDALLPRKAEELARDLEERLATTERWMSRNARI